MAQEYGFYGRLRREFPSQIIVDLTEYCNYACSHCPHANFAKSEIYTGAELPEELNKKLVDEVRTDGKDICTHIRYTAAGEPLLHPKAYDLLKYATENSGTMVSLTTNGSKLTAENRKKLLDMKIGLIDISLDANTAETYEKIRINGKFEQVKNNVLSLLNERSRGGYKTRIVVSFVKQPFNMHEAKQFEDFWYGQGVDFVIMRDLHTAAGANGVVLQVQKNRIPCVYPWERLCLSPKGMLGFCPASWLGLSDFIDFSEIKMADAWQGEFMKDLRQQHLDNHFKHESACYSCQDWSVIPWPDQKRSYGDMINKFSNNNN